MRILVIEDSERLARSLQGGLRKLGHEVHVVTSRFRTARESKDGVYRIGRNVLLPHLGALANVNAGLGLRREMQAIYARHDYDVVHVHEPMSPTLPLVAIEEACMALDFFEASHPDQQPDAATHDAQRGRDGSFAQ